MTRLARCYAGATRLVTSVSHRGLTRLDRKKEAFYERQTDHNTNPITAQAATKAVPADAGTDSVLLGSTRSSVVDFEDDDDVGLLPLPPSDSVVARAAAAQASAAAAAAVAQAQAEAQAAAAADAKAKAQAAAATKAAETAAARQRRRSTPRSPPVRGKFMNVLEQLLRPSCAEGIPQKVLIRFQGQFSVKQLDVATGRMYGRDGSDLCELLSSSSSDGKKTSLADLPVAFVSPGDFKSFTRRTLIEPRKGSVMFVNLRMQSLEYCIWAVQTYLTMLFDHLSRVAGLAAGTSPSVFSVADGKEVNLNQFHVNTYARRVVKDRWNAAVRELELQLQTQKSINSIDSISTAKLSQRPQATVCC